MKLLGILFLVLFSQSLFAISEVNFQTDYEQNVAPLLKIMYEGTFVGQNKVPIHFRRLINPGATSCLVILPGRSEPIEKYTEVVYDLLQTSSGRDLNYFLMDHRGQGQSGRMASPSDMGYNDHFDNYIKDVATFVQQMKLETKCQHRFLLAHSMGGGIATAFVLKYPKFFEKVALSSPMLKILTKPYPYAVARSIVEAQVLAGKGDQFAIKQKGYSRGGFEGSTTTTSPARFNKTSDIYELFPTTKLGGVSNRWLLETMRGTNKIRSRYDEISVPMRVFMAGLESFSESTEMKKLCDESANCRPLFFPTAKHELLMERDEVRNVVMTELASFFN